VAADSWLCGASGSDERMGLNWVLEDARIPIDIIERALAEYNATGGDYKIKQKREKQEEQSIDTGNLFLPTRGVAVKAHDQVGGVSSCCTNLKRKSETTCTNCSSRQYPVVASSGSGAALWTKSGTSASLKDDEVLAEPKGNMPIPAQIWPTTFTSDTATNRVKVARGSGENANPDSGRANMQTEHKTWSKQQLDDQEPRVSRPPRGSGRPVDSAVPRRISTAANGFDTWRQVYSQDAQKVMPALIAAAYSVAVNRVYDPAILDRAFSEYPRLTKLYRESEISSDDYSLVHEHLFNGHKPDVYYQEVAVKDPRQLEEYRDFIDNCLGHSAAVLYHSQHIWDEATIFKPGGKTKLRHQYGTIPLGTLLLESNSRVIVLRATVDQATWLVGHNIQQYPKNGTTDIPGLYYCSPERADGWAHQQVVPSYFALWKYYRRVLNDRKARRVAKAWKRLIMDGCGPERLGELGTNPEANVGVHRKYRAFGYGQRRRLAVDISTYLPGLTGLVESFSDAQTTARMKRHRRDLADRSRDKERLRNMHDRTKQTELRDAIDACLASIGVDDDVTESILHSLYPYVNEEMLQRTRIKWEQCVILLKQIAARTKSLDVVRLILMNTGGAGLQCFANVCVAMAWTDRLALFLGTLLYKGALRSGAKHFEKSMKALHALLRRTRELPQDVMDWDIPQALADGYLDNGATKLRQIEWDTRELLYMHLLVGRAHDNILGMDGYVEKRQAVPELHPAATRYGDRPVQFERWDKLVFEELEAMVPAVRNEIAKQVDLTPEEFHADFISVAPTGALGEGKHDLADIIDDVHNANKRTWLDNLSPEDIVDMVNIEPILKADAQLKVETGLKLRQIVPGPSKHWLNESVIMRYVEPAIYKSSEEYTLESTSWSIMTDHMERMQRTQVKRVTMASDYKDFNFLHTIPDMQSFWQMIKRATSGLEGPGKWAGLNYAGHVARLADWLCDALNHMYVREVAGDGKFHHILRSLWSGWRTTSVINNTFNKVYGRVLSRVCADIIGYDPIERARRNGDDSDAAVASVTAGLFYLAMMSYSGLEAQPSKQLLGVDESEYTRVTYRDGCAYAPIARGIASFVSSDLQAPAIDVGVEYIKGTNEALHALVRRGARADKIDEVRSELLMTWATQRFTDEDGSSHSVTLANEEILYVPVAEGGFGCSHFASPSAVRLVQPKPWPQARARWELPKSKHLGVLSLGSHLQRKMHSCRISSQVVDQVIDDARDIASQGVDRVHNSPWVEEARRLKAHHILELNIAQTMIVDNSQGMLESRWPGIYQLVASVLSETLNERWDKLPNRYIEPIDVAVERYISGALGLASISRNVISAMRDASSDRLLSPWEALERLTSVDSPDPRRVRSIAAPLATLRSNYNTAMIDACIRGSFKIDRDTAGLVATPVLPVIDLCHHAVLKKYFPGEWEALADAAKMFELLKDTNVVIADQFSEYEERWQLM